MKKIKSIRITVGGQPGSGKSTVAKLLAKRLNLAYYSVGNQLRSELLKLRKNNPKYRNLTLEKLQQGKGYAKLLKEMDKKLDLWQESLNSKQNFVLDSRLGAYWIKDAFKIYLIASLQERARRICLDRIKGKRKEEINENLSLKKINWLKEQKKIEKELKKIEANYVKRLKKLYGFSIQDLSNYDLIIDTTSLTPAEIVELIMKVLKKILKNGRNAKKSRKKAKRKNQANKKD